MRTNLSRKFDGAAGFSGRTVANAGLQAADMSPPNFLDRALDRDLSFKHLYYTFLQKHHSNVYDFEALLCLLGKYS